MMKKIRVLQVDFDAEIKVYETPAFRGAIIKKAGNEHTLFHNHTDNGFRYKYPLIQYKRIGTKPSILCIEEGVDDIHHFFANKDWTVEISGEKKDLRLKNLSVNQFTMQVWDKLFDYSIYSWLALNTENYKRYNNLDGLVEQIQFLEKLLTGNLLSFAKGINWTVGKEITVKIKKLNNTKIVSYKKQKLMAFDIHFASNLFIPNHIGLGKGVSVGFGTVMGE